MLTSNSWRADTGQRGEAPRAGIFINLTELFIWMVFDHFNNTWAPGCAKNISALANCLRVRRDSMRYQIGDPEKCKVSQENCSLKDETHVQIVTLLNNLDEKRGFYNGF